MDINTLIIAALVVSMVANLSMALFCWPFRLKRQQVEEALRESEARFRSYFELGLIGMAITSPEKGWVQYNDYLCQMLRYSREELGRLTWAEMTHPDDLAADVAQFNRVLAGEIDGYTVDKRFLRKDGGIVHTVLATRCRRQPNGAVDYFMVLVLDITERKRAELALQDNEQRWQRALDATGQGVWDWNVATNQVFFSPQWKAMLGYDRQEIGNRLEEWESRVHPDDLADCYRDLRRHFSGATPVFRNEHRVLCKDGHYKWILAQGMVFEWTADHQPLRIVGTHTDITQRKEAEEKLRLSEGRHRLLADNALDVIWTMAIDGTISYVSPAVEKVRGFTPAEAVQQSLEEILTPPSQAIVLNYFQSLQAAVQAGLPPESFRGELEYRCKDGSTLWTEVMAYPLLGPDGAFVEILGVTRDVSERKRHELELQQARDAAEAANRAKSEFLAHMSHEIRTPLNAVLGLAQVLNREPLTANQRDMVERIQAAGQSLLAIINDVLDFSKIEAGQLRLDPRPFDLGTLLAKLNGLMGQVAQAKGLALRVEAPATPPGWLVGDGLRLEQVLLNLMGNAIKFTEQGEVALRVQPCETGETAVRLRCEVRDTGIGIAPEALARLFTPFTQAEAGISRRFGGTGLGLSICKRLVELMGGVIGVDSQVGQGSTFWFELPFQRTAAGEAEALAVAVPALPLGPRLAGRHLLVVDDNALNRDLVERMLALEGARVTLAADGQQALQHLKAQPEAFAAVLMDIQMPVLDGLSATRAIRSELRLTELPVIALTAGVLAEQQQAARAAGVNDFLAKPVDLEQMVATLLRWTRPPAPADEVPQPAPETRAPGAAAQNRSAGLPEIPGFDAHQVALTFGDDREFFLELVGMFCASFRDTAQEVRADLATGAREAAARRLHTLKGTAGNLGALELMHSAQALERTIIDGQPEVEPLLEQFATQLDDLMQAVTPWLQECAAAPRGPGSTGSSSNAQFENFT